MSDAAIYWAFAIAFLAGMVIIGAHQFFGLRALEDRGEWAFDFWIGEGNVLGWWTAASLAAGGLLLGPVQSFAYLTWLAAEIYVLNAVLSKPLEVGIVTMAVIASRSGSPGASGYSRATRAPTPPVAARCTSSISG